MNKFKNLTLNQLLFLNFDLKDNEIEDWDYAVTYQCFLLGINRNEII